MIEGKRPLRVFLCHASQDKPAVRELYWRLVHDGVDVWLDETNLLPGMDWQMEIPKAVRNSDVIIICLSNQSVTKEGYVQKEIRFALDVADEKPDGTIFLIPVRLDACEIPSRLRRWQWVDMFSSDGYRKLRISLRVRADSMGKTLYTKKAKPERMTLLPATDLNQNIAPAPKDYSVELGAIGRLFALFMLFALTCAGIYWAGRSLVNAVSHVPMLTTVSATDAVSMGSPTVFLLSNTPNLIVPSETKVEPPTPFQPASLPTSTVPPISTMTWTLMPTQRAPATPLATIPFLPAAPEMSLIAAGSFRMGNDAGFADEKPSNVIYLNDFYMDKYEVTNLQYFSCVDSGICQSPSSNLLPADYFVNYPSLPIVNVSWQMAKTYCEWRGARLPTEAEWEKAARGGLEGAIYPWGDAAPSCNTGTTNGARLDECKGDGPIVIGSFKPNGYGLFDMIGNVSEWVNDWYDPQYYSLGSSLSSDPLGPSTGTQHVLRGGSWRQSHTLISVSIRGKNTIEYQSNQVGFRCAKDAP